MDVAAAVAAAERALVALARGRADGALDDRVAELALAATCAVASRFFAVGTPRSMGLVGGGDLARLHVDAHRVFYAPRELRCTDPEVASAVGGRVTSIEEACACDIVCVSAPDVRIARPWIRSGTHLNGPANVFDEVLLSVAKVVGDATHMYGTLAEVAAGMKDGRELDEISIFLVTRLPAVEAAVARSQP